MRHGAMNGDLRKRCLGEAKHRAVDLCSAVPGTVRSRALIVWDPAWWTVNLMDNNGKRIVLAHFDPAWFP